MQKRFCQDCGSELLMNAGFCPNCGSKVIQDTVTNDRDYDYDDIDYRGDGYDNLDLDDYEKDFIRKNSINPNKRINHSQQNLQKQPQKVQTQKKLNNKPAGKNRKDVIAIAALVCGILSIVLFMSIGVLFALTGLALSIICLIKKKNPKGFAIAGLVCSIIGCLMLTVRDTDTKRTIDTDKIETIADVETVDVSVESEADNEIETSNFDAEQKEDNVNPEDIKKQIEDYMQEDNPLNKLTEDLNLDVFDDNTSYESIYDEYAKKIKDKTPTLIEEYKQEAKNNNSGIEGLAELNNKQIEKLAEISNEGVEKMASYMYTRGKGKYDDYEEWSTKLYDVYMEESQKLTDEYMNSAMGSLGF